MALRHLALSYQIAFITPNKFVMTCDDCLFGLCLFAWAIEGAVPPKSLLASGTLLPREFCGNLIGPYPSQAHLGLARKPQQDVFRLEIALGPAAKGRWR
jgi:hypothetical protein